MPTPIIQLFAPEVVQVVRAAKGFVTPGDWAQTRLLPGIFDLLMNPLAGSAVPVGKNLHPMTIIPAGIAIDAATEACGEEETGVGVLRALEISMESPVSMKAPLEAIARVAEVGAHHVGVTVEVYEVYEVPNSPRPLDSERPHPLERVGAADSKASCPPKSSGNQQPGRLILKGKVVLVKVVAGKAAPIPAGPDTGV
ncbi:MAG: hypothetical protein IMX01_08850 [Limnochordaceae bacterium]|nr:hypothetical protein [Limnochordaceae bacterium]